MNGQINIEKMFAYIARDADGTEGLIGIMTPEGWMPLVGADLQRAASLKPYAQAMANELQSIVTLAVFSVREDLETLEVNRTTKKGEDNEGN
jgi:hypothetical protein